MIDGLSELMGQEITVEKGRVTQTNYDKHPMVRLAQAPPEIEGSLSLTSRQQPDGLGRTGYAAGIAGGDECDLHGDGEARAVAAVGESRDLAGLRGNSMATFKAGGGLGMLAKSVETSLDAADTSVSAPRRWGKDRDEIRIRREGKGRTGGRPTRAEGPGGTTCPTCPTCTACWFPLFLLLNSSRAGSAPDERRVASPEWATGVSAGGGAAEEPGSSIFRMAYQVFFRGKALLDTSFSGAEYPLPGAAAGRECRTD